MMDEEGPECFLGEYEYLATWLRIGCDLERSKEIPRGKSISYVYRKQSGEPEMRHVDVDKAIRNLTEAHASYKLPPDAPKHIVVQHRNYAIEKEIVRMCLSEENIHTEPAMIIYAFSGMIANFITNMSDGQEGSDEAIAEGLFQLTMLNLSGERTRGARIEIHEEEAGHA